jgi:Polyketide cyclase / dehydrase and lipid transport
MRSFTVHTSISAPREEVFDFVGDLAARVAYCDHYMQDFRLTRPKSSGVGAAARFVLDSPLASTWCEIAIAEYERPRRIVERARVWRLGRTPAVAVYEFLQDVQGVTRVELTVWTEPATRIDALKEATGARRWLRGQTKGSLERLRLVFEEEREAPLARASIAGYEPLKAARFGST